MAPGPCARASERGPGDPCLRGPPLCRGRACVCRELRERPEGSLASDSRAARCLPGSGLLRGKTLPQEGGSWERVVRATAWPPARAPISGLTVRWALPLGLGGAWMKLLHS